MSDFQLEGKKEPVPRSHIVTSPSVTQFLYHHFTCHGLPSLFQQRTVFIGTVVLSGRQTGFSVPAHVKTFLLLLFS